MNLNEYFHIGNPHQPLRLMAADTTPGMLDTQYSKRSNPNSTWMGRMYGGEYNPDKLDWKVYDKMLLNPQIRSCITFIDYARLSKKWMITPASEEKDDILIADFVRDVIENLRTPFRLVRKNMYTSLRYGYSVGEVNFTTRMIKGDTRIVWDTIQPIHIGTLKNCFEYNNDNTVKTVWQRPLGSYAGQPIPIPGWKCLINSFDEIFANKYGNSGLRSVYDNYFMIGKISRWYANYLYKLEGPAIIGKSSNKEDLQKILDDFQEGTLTGVIEPDDEVTIIESQHRGEGFITAINHHNHMIAINFMIGSLMLGQAESQGGSYAQSKTHLDVAQIYLDGLHEDDSIPVQEQIRQLVDLNFTVDKYPKFSFEKFTQKDLLALLEALQPYAQQFFIDTKNTGWNELFKQIFKQYADIDIDLDEVENVASETINNKTNPEEITTNTDVTPPVVDQLKQVLP